jgi:hypothetical protein
LETCSDQTHHHVDVFFVISQTNHYILHFHLNLIHLIHLIHHIYVFDLDLISHLIVLHPIIVICQCDVKRWIEWSECNWHERVREWVERRSSAFTVTIRV